MIHLPDLLNPVPQPARQEARLDEVLELAFLGSESRAELHEAVYAGNLPPPAWYPPHFADDLFLGELIEGCFAFTTPRRRHMAHAGFMQRFLSHPAADLDTVVFRQGVLRELESDASVRGRTETLYDDLNGLLGLFKAMRTDGRLNFPAMRLDILRHTREIVDGMAENFRGAASGLRRLHEASLEIQGSQEYETLAALLDHEANSGLVNLDVRFGADGRLRALAVRAVRENSANPFYQSPWRRWFEITRLRLRHYDVDPYQLVDRAILAVYHRIAPVIRTLLQLICQIEAYLAALGFAALVRGRGLEVCLPELAADSRLVLEDLVNPLLLRGVDRPVPCSIEVERNEAVVVVTGPNSGGKTRLLQAVGLTQVLAQGGLFAPCARAGVPLAQGLFVSLVEPGGADEVEGRLGNELVRIRRMFESVPPRSVILLDELCSGTNPSEAIEIVSMVLRLLRELRPVALVTTHFLDFARRIEATDEIPGVTFLQVQVDEHHHSTYQFVPGVATTSMAAGTARRLGVTFEELSELLHRRTHQPGQPGAAGAEPDTAPTPARRPGQE
jgi:DNA mismatch repair protein MutS2